MRRRLLATLCCLPLAVLAGCGGDDGGGATATATATEAPAAASPDAPPTDGCRTVAAAAAKSVDRQPPTTRLPADATVTVTLRTNCGDIPIELDQRRQPRTAASFAQLVRDGVYDGLSFHRIVPGFVIQGGDPEGTGAGGPGYTITERPPRDAAYTRGVVAMAKTQVEPAGTSGSQFFIVTGEDAQLPPDYAIVGRVVGDGMTVADRIAAVPTNAEEAPTSPVVIEQATLRER